MLNFDKIKQAGSLMKQMNNLKKKIDQLESVAETNDGSVKVVVKGTSSIKFIEIDSSLLNENSKNSLEKNLIKIINEALKKAESSSKNIMSEVTGGLNIPGM
jgi:DNA-binding YbaB/EbfC family protein